MSVRAGFHGTVGQPTAQVIAGGLKFQDDNSAYLSRTPSSAGNRKTWTFSCWVKRSEIGSIYPALLSAGSASGDTGFFQITFESDEFSAFMRHSSGTNYYYTNALLRDISSWYHLVVAMDTTQSAEADRLKMYINGVEPTYRNKSVPSQDQTFLVNNTSLHQIGATKNIGGTTSLFLPGYLSNVYLIDGQALNASYFGFTDPLTNTWRPKKYEGTFGTNGFYLPMDNQDDFEKDKSVNKHIFTKNNFSGTSSNPDVVKDSPSGVAFGGPPITGITTTSSGPANYATLNPININDMGGTTSVTFSDANLTVANARNTYFGTALSTLSMTTGKYYCEGTVDSNDASTLLCGILKIDFLESRWNTDDEQIGYFQYGYGYRSNNGNKENNSSNSSYGNSYGDGDTIGIALDLDAKTISFYKNGTNQGVAYSGIPAGQYAFGFSCSETNNKWKANFGQKPFKYAPPEGYLPLSSATVRPETVITRPDQYVGIITYTGNDATTHSINGLNFDTVPDLVWIKNRDQTEKHILHDTVRGVGDVIYTTSTQASDTGSPYTDRYQSFDFNGFTVGTTHSGTNSDGDDFVAWCWKAGGNKGTFNVDGRAYATSTAAGLPTQSGSGGGISVSACSVGTKQGFSIIKYGGGGNGENGIPHGLGRVPKFYIVKNITSGSSYWTMYHVGMGNTKGIYFDTDGANTNDWWDNTTPTEDLFYVKQASLYLHNGSDTYISYLWCDVPGLQKFGTYEGNNNSNGPFVELGFNPAVVWTKGIDSNSHGWEVHWNSGPSLRQNPQSERLMLDQEASKATSNHVDFLSNGFKIRNTFSGMNSTSDTYIYCAWADVPTSNLFGGQTNAR